MNFAPGTGSPSGTHRLATITDITTVMKRTVKPKPDHPLQPVVLVDIFEADFRHSEMSLWSEYVTNFSRQTRAFKKNEVVCFVNKGGNQMLWILGEGRIGQYRILDTRRWRILQGGIWDPELIIYYAHYIGFDLVVPSKRTVGEILSQVI